MTDSVNFNAEKVEGGWIIQTEVGTKVVTKDSDVIKSLKSSILKANGVSEATDDTRQVLNEG